MSIALAGVLILLLCSPAFAESPAFDWTMPPRLGQDLAPDRRIDYPTSAGEVPAGPYEVRLRVADHLCNEDSKYRWVIEGQPAGSRSGDCGLTHLFDREGTFDVALTVVAEGGEQSFEREVIVQDWLIVSLGDSVASGEGNPDRRGTFRVARWHDARCHRSRHAAPVQAALALEAERRTSTTFVQLACSGAKLSTGLLEEYGGIERADGMRPRLLAPQLAELRKIAVGREVDAVLVSAGANDMHFGDIVVFCLRTRRCHERSFSPDAETEALPIDEVVGAALTDVRGRLEAVERALPARLDRSRVFFIEYFDPTRDQDGATCRRIGLPVSRKYAIRRPEAEWARRRILEPLNAVIADAAEANDWRVVDGVAEAFRAHGYCAGRDRWIRTIARSLVTQRGATRRARTTGALHPDEDGHHATATLITAAVQRDLYDDDLPREPEEDERGGGEPDGESDAEEHAVESLGLWILLGLVGAALLWGLVKLLRRRPRRPVPPAAPKRPAPAWGQASPQNDGRPLAELLLTFNAWVHRRVESLEFVDALTVRRRVSVDFTVPEPLRAAGRVPIALVQKGIPLVHFDLVDEEGASLPLLTRDQGVVLGEACLLALAEDAMGGPAPEVVTELCRQVILSTGPDDPDLAAAQGAVPAGALAQLEGDDDFAALAQMFTESYPIVLAIDDLARRRVLKYAYDEQSEVPRPPLRSRAGLDPLVFITDVPEVGAATTHHVEFRRAEGVEMVDSYFIAVDPSGVLVDETRQADLSSEVHLFLSGQPRDRSGVAWTELRAERTGIVIGAPLFALLTTFALVAAWFGLPDVAVRTDNIGALVLAVPAALAAYLGTMKEHPVRRLMLSGIRTLVLLCGLMAFVTAGALAVDLSTSALRWVIGVAALVSAAALAGLALMWERPRRRR